MVSEAVAEFRKMLMTSASPQGTCRAPGCNSMNLCKAHIVPRGFAKDVQRDDATNLRVTATGSNRAKPPLGDYDPDILCGDCDRLLGQLDQYALETLKRFDALPRKLGQMIGMPGVDGDHLARFVLSVIWRASISQREPYANLSLGPYEERAGLVAFGKIPLVDLPEYDLLAFRYHSDDGFDPRRFYSAPTSVRSDGINTISVALAGVRMIAKMDKRSFPAEIRPVVVNGNDNLLALVVDYKSGNDFRTIVSSIQSQFKRGVRSS